MITVGFDRGVTHYTQAIIPVWFPGDEVVCRYCPLCKLRLMHGKAEAVCQATGELLYNVDHRPDGCPAEVVEREENNGKSEHQSEHL